MDEGDYAALRPVSASMGLMLETASDRLSERGGPHFGSPDKIPARRLESIEAAGRAQVPFTKGLLLGIGETRAARSEERRVGKECGRTWRSRWSAYLKKNNYQMI